MNALSSMREWVGTVRLLFVAAMAVFLVTIAIGILNGIDAVEFNRDQVLTHVHSGTLGWVTLSIVAAAAWFARGVDRRLALGLAILIPVYVALFYVAWAPGRAVAGVTLLVVIVALLAWAWRVASRTGSLPGLAIALGITTFTYGAVIGVLRQVQLANGASLFPDTADVVGAHASAMVFSYLILVAMGLLEWRVLGTVGRPRSGVAQLVLLFVGGAIISATLLLLPRSAQQPAGGIYLLVELIAVILFSVRVLPTAVRRATRSAADAHIAVSSVFVVVATLVFLYLVSQFIADPNLDVTDPSITGILTASDHAAFIGVITNLMLALLLRFTADRLQRTRTWDRIAFWGINLGLLVFIVGLVLNEATIKRVGAPIMGASILLALALAAWRLRTSSLEAADRPDTTATA